MSISNTKHSSGGRGKSQTVDEYMSGLEHPHKDGVEALRRAILSSDARIGEEVKWNAPSFRMDDHFATFRLHPAPIFQLILHTGAKAKNAPQSFEIEDPDGLLKWAAKDRSVISFVSSADALAKRDAVVRVVREWIARI
jgi:hypothetical protein